MTYADLDPDALFVIACPICFGQVAAVSRMAGVAACCPLCAGSFRVPNPQVAAAVVATPEPQPVAFEPATIAAAPAASDLFPAMVEPAPVSVEHPPSPAAAPFAVDIPAIEVPAAVAATPVAEMQFHEPVKTVGRGAARMELRRLTDEERRIRRSRRNLMLLLVGAAMLIMIVVLLGIPARRR